MRRRPWTWTCTPVTGRPDDGGHRAGPALEAMYQLAKWLIPVLDRFPRRQKFLLGDRIQTTAVDVLERLVEATFTRDRTRLLDRTNFRHCFAAGRPAPPHIVFRAVGRCGRTGPGAWPAPERRVLRGGSWNNKPQNLRSANRNRNTAGNRNNNAGFRVASTAQPPESSRPRARGACTGRPGPVMTSALRLCRSVRCRAAPALGPRGRRAPSFLSSVSDAQGASPRTAFRRPDMYAGACRRRGLNRAMEPRNRAESSLCPAVRGTAFAANLRIP